MRLPFTTNDGSLRRIAAAYVLLVFVFEAYGVGVEYSPYFAYLMDSESGFFIAVTIVCFLLSFFFFYLFVLSVLTFGWAYRVGCLALFGLALAVEYG